MAATFSTDITGLPEAAESELLELGDGDTLNLRLSPVTKHLGGAAVRMLAYNGSIPGPTLKVRQGTEIVVCVTNETDIEATVHWHGLRLDNRYDGVPHETQEPIPVGGHFTYRLQFPDPGLYWYHPHIREDYTQEMGLYGNILVVPTEPNYWPPVHRDLLLTLDDVLIEDGAIAPFSRTETNFAAMGRYGNLLLIGGETDLALTVRAGEVTRLWLTNTANSRVFNVGLPGVRMKLVGGDSGRIEHEEFVTNVVLAPSERAAVDVLFDRSGQFTLEHRTPARSYRLASVTVTEDGSETSLRDTFQTLRRAPELEAEREQLQSWLAAAPDKILAVVAEMDDPAAPTGPVSYVCPMHPEVVSDQPGRCPRCGMKLMAAQPAHHSAGQGTGHDMADGNTVHDMAVPTTAGYDAVAPDRSVQGGTQEETSGHKHTSGHEHSSHRGSTGEGTGIEWEDDMVELNRRTTAATMRWKLLDRTTGGNSPPVDWRFRVGERVKIRLVNEMDSDHPMHHPFHIHGAGRFLVLARDGVAEPNLGWKDTVLIRTGQTVDILLDVTHRGTWMAHCHIAEHMHSGMMFSFTVAAGATT